MEDRGQFTYPAPYCIRLGPVPQRDCAFVNTDASGVQTAHLTKDAKASHETPIWQLYPLLPEPVRLSETRSFPGVKTFLKALEELREQDCHPSPTFADFDNQLLSCFQGYEPFKTDKDYYVRETLKGLPMCARAFKIFKFL
jgi:hypothetical protein